jgi:hypothetical protein
VDVYEGSIDFDFAPRSNINLEQCLISIKADRNISLNNASLKKLNNPLAVIISFNASLNMLSIREATENKGYSSTQLKILNANNPQPRSAHLKVNTYLDALNYPKEPHTFQVEV